MAWHTAPECYAPPALMIRMEIYELTSMVLALAFKGYSNWKTFNSEWPLHLTSFG